MAPHTFHIPVMGIGYTIDTPIKVAHFGIDSVVSIIDHRIVEEIREYHSNLNQIPFTAIPEDEEDCRAKRITVYLDFMNNLVQANFKKLKEGSFDSDSELTKYFEMLPDTSALKKDYELMLQADEESKPQKQALLKEKMLSGSIDVNIMTKLDSVNYSKDNEALPVQYNDAHASLRGFANSTLESSIVLSAGLNPRLYAYIAEFKDFFPDSSGILKKKIVLKVSDYRSAIVQGKMLAKKGLWVSEFRVESGLNCGGHAFATEGNLLGPILNEFKENKANLIDELFEVYSRGLSSANKEVPEKAPKMILTAQGGVGTYDEHKFLINHYGVESIGWGSPFLLVPEAANVDDKTLDLLAKTDESGYYLSEISPMGILFNTLKGNSGEVEKLKRIEAGKPGAPCTKKYLIFNTEYTERPICAASVQYQKLKIEELKSKNLEQKDYKEQFNKITDKVCLCVGLANSTLLKNKMKMKPGTQGVSVCPGPNLAYFTKSASLKEMVNHIYGRVNLITRNDRPNMFIQELKMYVDYFKSKILDSSEQLGKAQTKHFVGYQKNLNEGIAYYHNLFSNLKNQSNETLSNIQESLTGLQKELNSIIIPEFKSAAG